MRSLIYVERLFNRLSDLLGWLSSILFILLVVNVVYDVVMRYAFNDVSIAFQELEWHLFATVFYLVFLTPLKRAAMYESICSMNVYR